MSRRRRRDIPGTIYLLHFDRPFHHAQHYIGWTESADVEPRVEEHRSGNGSCLMRAVVAAGIQFSLVRTWPGETRNTERRLKDSRQTRRLCPVCRQAAMQANAERMRRLRARRRAESVVTVLT